MPTSLAELTGNANTSWVSSICNYTATRTAPILIFGFDASSAMYIALDDVSVVDIAFPSIELLNNPSFQNSSSGPTGWTQWCSYTCGSGTAGNVTSTGCRTGRCYASKCNSGGLDYIGQAFAATIGRTYNISFWSQRVRFLSTPNNPVTLYAGIT
jgi:hypothetical protein